MASKNNLTLDKLCLMGDVTKKTKEDYGHREEACTCQLFIESARWDIQLQDRRSSPAQGIDSSHASHLCKSYSPGSKGN
nr:dynein heavy chain 11, axonemal-like [Anas platyrhynchos]|eukprot:XP_027306722.1 dynein heavy chain 11, axonemal-like [Anas platyrhynchos]